MVRIRNQASLYWQYFDMSYCTFNGHDSPEAEGIAVDERSDFYNNRLWYPTTLPFSPTGNRVWVDMSFLKEQEDVLSGFTQKLINSRSCLDRVSGQRKKTQLGKSES
ncbi:hypothetical protein AAES_62885 [Amazona aestiva]|uniref:Uncharacterized protein n=1 Tax=Amazona aestiva TaxID=12930 RepID=A0A0Q3Q4M2_AMAAE|nr:hypothetical protein AAES_62885 [Amazona aestiva]